MMMKKIITHLFMGAMLLTYVAASAQDGLFISEIADPGDEYTGRFIELFNAGSESVDFANMVFYLSRQSNGGTTWGEVQLTGTVAAGATYVIGGSAFESFYGFAPDLVSGILTGNGDDPYSLYEGGGHESGMLHDIYGDKNTDGTGEPWEYTDSRAVREPDVDDPRILWSALEWNITPANIADCDPGTHNGSTPVDPGPEPGDFALRIVSDTAEAGQPVGLSLAVSELTSGDDIISYQFDVEYDQTLLQYSYCSVVGTLADGGTLADNEATAGKVSISYMNTEAITGAGNILILQFNSLGMGTAGLSISNAFLNNIPVTDLIAGEVLIAETAPPTAAVTYDDTENRLADMLMITATFTEPMDIANPVLLNLDGAAVLTNAAMSRLSDTTYAYLYAVPNSVGVVNVSLSNGTDLWGNELEAVPSSGETFNIIALRPGDVNDDGEVQAYDAALTLQHSVGLDPLPEEDDLPWENWRDSTANVNGDGAITAYDAGLILQYSAGVISDFSGSAKKSISLADVSLEVEGDRVVFYSHGDLVGLNVSTTDTYKSLGVPGILFESPTSPNASNFISASNIGEQEYRIGLCTSTSPPEGTAIMEIPFSKSGPMTFSMLINAEEKEVTVDLFTDLTKTRSARLNIYPNPATDILRISGLTVVTVARICNIQGQEVFSGIFEGDEGVVEVSDLPAGIYMMRLEMDDHTVDKRFIKK
jgi:hypothetical protein